VSVRDDRKGCWLCRCVRGDRFRPPSHREWKTDDDELAWSIRWSGGEPKVGLRGDLKGYLWCSTIGIIIMV
jgi:hypothetical protein